MSRDDSRESEVSRRSVLKAVGAGAGAAVIPSLGAETASASDVTQAEMERTAAAHDDAVRAQWTVAEQAQSVLDELAAEEVLSPDDLDALDFEGAETLGMQKDGVAAGQITVPVETDDYTGEVVVRPELDEALASVTPRDGGDPLTVDARGDEVEAKDVRTELDCSTTKCFAGCYQFSQSCVDGNCETVTDGCCACPDPL
jgi:hypothetical protein